MNLPVDATVNQGRRYFLKATAMAGGGLAIAVYVPGLLRLAQAADARDTFAPSAWIRIGSDNVVTVIVDKSEMGQGVYTSLPMIVAEELDADWPKLHTEPAPVAPEYRHPWFGVQATGGSTSVRAMWTPLRYAGATARAILVSAAAQRWNVDPATLTARRGRVLGPNGRHASYGELAALAATLPLPKKVKLKDPKDFTLIGKPVKRLDTPEKVDGSARFGIDVKLPGLLTAVVARSPVVGGKLRGFKADKALAIKGVKRVLPVQSPTAAGVAVLADTYWQAKRGRDALEIDWDPGASATLSSAGMEREMEALAQSGLGAVAARNSGDIGNAQPAHIIEALYHVPYLAHACMEPMNYTAWVKPDAAQLWGGTQAPGPNQATASALLGIPREHISVATQLLGGGFGRRFAPDFITEAVALSKAAGAPVKVQYSREDDMHAYYYRPMAVCRIRGGLDAAGNPVLFDARTVCDSLAAGTGMEAKIIKDGIDSTSVEGLNNLPYAVPNVRVEWIKYSPGIRTWFLRSVGSSQNIFFAESFIDELAHAAGKDPFEFRRILLAKRPRLHAVLELAAAKAGWGRPLPPGRARGIAVAESFGSYVAEVAEVSLKDGKPRVHRVVIAADVGTVVNPDTVRAQMEGAMVYGLSAALYGRIEFKDGRVVQNNFDGYPVLRMDEMPRVDVHLVHNGKPPGGVGEPGVPPIAPALTNALFVLTGKRIRRLPIVT